MKTKRGHCGKYTVHWSYLILLRAQHSSNGTSPFDCRSPRKLSGASVASFASSFQDYCRKLSGSSVGAGSTVGDQTNPISPTAIAFPHSSAEAAVSSAKATGVAVRKFSDPNDYGRRRRSTGGGGKAPLFFELDRAGELRRLASTSLERYRPYMSRLALFKRYGNDEPDPLIYRY